MQLDSYLSPICNRSNADIARRLREIPPGRRAKQILTNEGTFYAVSDCSNPWHMRLIWTHWCVAGPFHLDLTHYLEGRMHMAT